MVASLRYSTCEKSQSILQSVSLHLSEIVFVVDEKYSEQNKSCIGFSHNKIIPHSVRYQAVFISSFIIITIFLSFCVSCGCMGVLEKISACFENQICFFVLYKLKSIPCVFFATFFSHIRCSGSESVFCERNELLCGLRNLSKFHFCNAAQVS